MSGRSPGLSPTKRIIIGVKTFQDRCRGPAVSAAYCISSATTAPDDVSVYSKPAGIDEEGSPNNAGKWSANINFKSAATLDTDGKAIKEGTQYYVYFIAKDAVGNISAPSAGVPVKVDDTAPKSTLVGECLYDATGESATAPSDKATYLAKEAFTVTGEITEENFKSATISVNDGTAVDFGAENSLVTFTDEAKTKWKLAPTLTDGSYKYVISLEDEAENTQSYTITINRDTTGPVVTILRVLPKSTRICIKAMQKKSLRLFLMKSPQRYPKVSALNCADLAFFPSAPEKHARDVIPEPAKKSALKLKPFRFLKPVKN